MLFEYATRGKDIITIERCASLQKQVSSEHRAKVEELPALIHAEDRVVVDKIEWVFEHSIQSALTWRI